METKIRFECEKGVIATPDEVVFYKEVIQFFASHCPYREHNKCRCSDIACRSIYILNHPNLLLGKLDKIKEL